MNGNMITLDLSKFSIKELEELKDLMEYIDKEDHFEIEWYIEERKNQ
jgi:hypothetical protein